MSAVILTSIGQAAGGPLGALTGSMVGRVADKALERFGKAAPNAFPGDQGASYGAIVPRIFGRMRTAGTVIWAQPMRRAGGGKGGGQRAYVVSFAVALSSRPVLSIGRIWADGREIRGTDGRSEFPIILRLHSAGAARSADPLISAVEGHGRAPSYASLSYVVLEDFPLASFANRVPFLDFEVIADVPAEADRAAIGWAEDVSGQKVEHAAEAPLRPLQGWSAGSAEVRQDLAALLKASGLVLGERDGALTVRAAGSAQPLSQDDACVHDGKSSLSLERSIGVQPQSAAVAHADPARDYLVSDQQVFQRGLGAPVRIDLPMAMDAPAARALAKAMLLEPDAAADTLSMSLPPRYLSINVGDQIAIEGLRGVWRVVSRAFENFEARLECVVAPPPVAGGASDAGRAVRMPVSPQSAARLAVFEIPDRIGSVPASGIVIGVSADPLWRGAELYVDDGAQLVPAGLARNPIVAGVLLSPLPPGPATSWDETNQIELRLDGSDTWLESRTAQTVLSGANMALCGGELLQFRDVVMTGPREARLSGLLRRRLGTTPAGATHAAGTSFWVLDAANLRAHPLGVDAIGRTIRVTALSAGNQLEVAHRFDGLCHAPLAPCHVRARKRPGGDLDIRWVARDRRLMEWSDADVAPTADHAVVEVWDAGLMLVSRRVTGSATVFTASDQMAAAGHLFGAVRVRVVAEGSGPAAFRESEFVRCA